MVKSLICVFLGSALGGGCRYLLGIGLKKVSEGLIMPIPTLVVNMLGCFLIGIFYSVISKYTINDSWRLLLVVGFCGSFTTFSTFIYESNGLMTEHIGYAFGYMVLSVVLGLGALWVGMKW